MSIDDLIEWWQPTEPPWNWDTARIRSLCDDVAGAARRELARELLAMPGYEDDLIMRLHEIAEEGE